MTPGWKALEISLKSTEVNWEKGLLHLKYFIIANLEVVVDTSHFIDLDV